MPVTHNNTNTYNDPSLRRMTDTPVLISGAGPTGLFAGLLLLKMNIPCRIIERNLKISPLSKALGIHARTQEIFQMTDSALIQRFRNESHSGKSVHIYYGDKIAASIQPIESNETRYNELRLLRQEETVRILTEAFEKEGGKIEYGWELMDTKVVQDDEDESVSWVETTIRKASNGSNKRSGESTYLGAVVLEGEDEGKEYEYETVKSQFLIGADGGRSAVRHKLGTTFPGRTRDYNMIIFDGIVEANVPLDHISSFNVNHCRNVAMFPLGQKNRVQLTLNKGRLTDEQFEAQKAEELTVEYFQQLLDETLSPIEMKIKETFWLTYYRINERRAKEYSHKGRIFLAGDAAHVHSPAAGQGLNLGLQDVHNLAWKIALVVNGSAPRSLVDSYEEERPAIADEVIKLVAQSQDNEFGLDGGFKRFIKRTVLTYLLPYMRPFLAEKIATISMIRLRYHENSLNKEHRTQCAVSGPGSIGERAADGPLAPFVYENIATADRDSETGALATLTTPMDKAGVLPATRLHELLVHPGAFQVLVFTGQQWLHLPETALGLEKSMNYYLDSWRSKWPAMNEKDKSPRYQFMVHTFASLSPCEATAKNALMLKDDGEGRAYSDLEGVLHRRYGVDPMVKNGQETGAIVVLRPDAFIAYRVEGVNESAWNDVDEYLRSILV
ncbi:hypothetical protein BGZ83_010217 [Gryganskiella cystojenkinii]|nr:hypothetical protein BGZ83_010217 [Gryganskiella cystojenkinii]